jgi:hypothetical protein
MIQYFENENMFEMFMNDVMEEKYQLNPIFQIENNQSSKNEEK